MRRSSHERAFARGNRQDARAIGHGDVLALMGDTDASRAAEPARSGQIHLKPMNRRHAK
jgi:hypothetical protein